MNTRLIRYKAKTFKHRNLMLFFPVILLLAAYVSPFSTSQPDAPTSISLTRQVAPVPLSHGLVDIGGRSLWFQCVGQGTPTVILEAGGPDDSSYWFKVQTVADQGFRVCSYDRANLGMSDKAPIPRTFADMAQDLHSLLVNAGIEGPYILVGHSMGGMLVRVFTDHYPDEVAGLVLVDAAHPDMGHRLLAGLPEKSLFESKAIRAWRQYLTWQSDSTGQNKANIEGVNFQISNEQVRSAQPLGDLPLVVISRSPSNREWQGMPTLPAEINSTLFQIWQDLQNELAGLSSNSTHLFASHAGHMIPTEEPELVIQSIRKLVNDVRGQTGISDTETTPVEQTHAPKILRVEDRPSERRNGMLILYKDIIFSDEDGDAIFDQPSMYSVDPSGDYHLLGGFIPSSSDEQVRGVARDPIYVGCPSQATFLIDVRIIDQAFNQSEPVRLTFNCPSYKMYFSPSLIIGLVLGLCVLGVAIWLIVRHRCTRRVSA